MTLTRVVGRKSLELSIFEAKAAVDDKAREVRARFATDGKHQVYAEKRDEATRYIAADAEPGPAPDLTDYPYLAAEVGITAPTPLALAQLWLEMDSQWRRVAATIESISLNAKSQIGSADSRAEMDAIAAAAVAALDGIGEKPPERPKKPPNRGRPF